MVSQPKQPRRIIDHEWLFIQQTKITKEYSKLYDDYKTLYLEEKEKNRLLSEKNDIQRTS